MRVIAGSAKGTRLYGAKGYRVRPIIDRVKESVFGLLGERVTGARVLDLYAGVGSLGIEALSRGAVFADFIEKHPATARSIKENLERARLAEEARVHVAVLPGGIARARGPYGLIFVDPPFRIDRRSLEELFRRIADRGLLEPSGLLVYRYSPRKVFDPGDEWSMVERRDYGDSIVSIFSLGDMEETAHGGST